MEHKDASWATKIFRKNQRMALETPGDSRAAVAAKESRPQAARGITAHVPPQCSESLGSEATPFQDHPAQVQLFYGAKRVSNAGGHDPCTGLPTFTRAYALRLTATREKLHTPPPGARARGHL